MEHIVFFVQLTITKFYQYLLYLSAGVKICFSLRKSCHVRCVVQSRSALMRGSDGSGVGSEGGYPDCSGDCGVCVAEGGLSALCLQRG